MHGEIDLKAFVEKLNRDELGDFSGLKPEDQTQQGAHGWFYVKLAMLVGSPDRATEYFYQIPVELRDEKICTLYVQHAPLEIKHVSEKHPAYKQVVLAALKRNEASLYFIHADFHTEAMLQFLMLQANTYIPRIVRSCDWARRVLTPELVEMACGLNGELALALHADQLTDKALANVATLQINCFNRIRDAGRLDLLTRPLAQGHWPHSNRVTGELRKPSGLANGVRLLFEARSEDEEALYMAYITTHPIENIVKVLGGQSGRLFLMEMFSTDKLRPYVSSMDRSLRGVFLESELGL